MKTTAQKNHKKNKSSNTGNQQQNPYIVVSYYKGLSESLKRTCNKYGVQVYFKGSNTIRSLLMAPKDKDPMLKKSGVIYRYKCDRVECDEEYIGESSRTFEERFKEHQKAQSPICDHYNTTGHKMDFPSATFSCCNMPICGLTSATNIRIKKKGSNICLPDTIEMITSASAVYHLPHNIWL